MGMGSRKKDSTSTQLWKGEELILRLPEEEAPIRLHLLRNEMNLESRRETLGSEKG